MKVNPKDKALKSICKKLDEKEAIYDEEAVSRVVDDLYDAYEADGTIPTREAFAEACQDETVADAVKAMKRDPFEKRSLGKGGIVAICIACAVIVAFIVGAAVIVPTWAGSEIENAEVLEDEETAVLSVGVSAEEWDAETSTPVIVHVVNEDLGIDYYHAYDANVEEILDADVGDGYTVSFISAVNADGSIYRVPEEQTIETYDAESGDWDDLPYTFELVPAEDVTADELTEIIAQITEAIQSGDETLAGENSAAIAEKAEENCKANENADEALQSGSSAQTGSSSVTSGNNSNSSSGSNSSSSSGNSASSNSSNSTSSGNSSSNSSSGSSSGSSSASSSGSSSSSSSSSHTHNWVYHSAVTEERSICSVCGEDITGNTTAHGKAHVLAGEGGGYYGSLVTTQEAYYSCSCGATK